MKTINSNFDISFPFNFMIIQQYKKVKKLKINKKN